MKFTEGLRRTYAEHRSSFMYRYFPGLVDRVVAAGTWSARRKISTAKADCILVDSSVIGHAVTHETAWIDTGEKLWGGTVSVQTGYAARIPVHSEIDQREVARSVRLLPGIAPLARRCALRLFTSSELRVISPH